MPGPQRPCRRVGGVALVVVLLLAGGAWWLFRPKPRDAEPVAAAGRSNATAAPLPAVVESSRDATPVAPSRSLEAAPVVDPNEVRPAPESYTRELSGVHGRLVEADGNPAPGVPVELVDVRVDAFLSMFEGGFFELPPDVSKLDVAHDTSAQDGTFELKGTMVASLHVLGVDLGGERSTFRVLDAALERGKSYDLGDVVLQTGTTLTGTVADEDGAPVAGARVRVLPDLGLPIPIPPMLFDSADVQDVRTDCSALAIVAKNALRAKIDAPPPLRFLLDRLPLPTTRSGADGKFRIVGVPPGAVTLLADLPKKLGTVRSGVQVPRGRPELDVGTVGVMDGRTVGGRLVAGETPIAGAKVCVGALLPIPTDEVKIAVGHPAGVTDADGRFSLAGLPINGEVICAAQRVDGGPWQLFGPFAQDDLKVEFPPAATLTVLVQDHDGKPVEHAELRLVDRNSPLEQMPIQLANPPSRPAGAVHEVEPGHYELSDQPLGQWSVLARAADTGVGSVDVELGAEGAVATITLPAPRTIVVKALDAATHEPVDFALATALIGDLSHGPRNVSFAAVRTNHDGVATLHQLPAATKVAVRVAHPGYVTATAHVDGAATKDVELALLRGGDLVGHVTCGKDPPSRPLLLVLSRVDDAPDEFGDVLPRLAATFPDGSFRVRHLAAGKWRWALFRRFLDVNPLELTKLAFDLPDEMKNGGAEIEEGKETSLEIAAEPLGDLGTATVRGVVRVDGEVVEGLDVEVRVSHRRTERAKTDASGRFELTGVRSGRAALDVFDSRNGERSSVGGQLLELRAGETKDVELDLRPIVVTVTVRDAEGAPIADASVWPRRRAVEPDDGPTALVMASTDPHGNAKLTLPAGSWRLNVRADGVGHTQQDLELGARERVRAVDVTLVGGVTVSGSVVFDGAAPTTDFCFLFLKPAEAAGAEELDDFDQTDNLEPPDHRFEIKGVKPGLYDATVEGSFDEEYEPIRVDVGARGESNLVLRFKRKS